MVPIVMVIKFLDRNLQVSSSSFCYTQSILFSSVHYKHHFSDVHTVLHFQAIKLVVHVQALKISVAKYSSNGEIKSNQKQRERWIFCVKHTVGLKCCFLKVDISHLLICLWYLTKYTGYIIECNHKSSFIYLTFILIGTHQNSNSEKSCTLSPQEI